MSVTIGVGSNINTPIAQVLSGCRALGLCDQITVLKSSSLYRTRPVGPQDQPDFINRVVQCETTLSPLELLSVLQGIEQQYGRKREGLRFGPRTLDLDILLYDNQVIESQTLCVPHPGMMARAFVLYPLHEIAPNLVFPDGTALASQLQVVSCDGIHQLTEYEAEMYE